MQLNYSQNFQPAVAGGLIYPFEENTILTYSNPTEQIQWGKGLVIHTMGGGGGGTEAEGDCSCEGGKGDPSSVVGGVDSSVSVSINDRRGFSFNATICSPTALLKLTSSPIDPSLFFSASMNAFPTASLIS